MKKALILLGLSAIFWVGCESAYSPEADLRLPISITAGLDGGNGLFTAEISQDGCKISFDESSSLYGTALEFSEGSGTAVIGDFSREAELDMFPAQSALIRAIRGINDPNNQPVETDRGFKYAIDEMTIMVYYDKNAEKIIGIGTEEEGRHFKFNVADLMPYEEPSNGEGKP